MRRWLPVLALLSFADPARALGLPRRMVWAGMNHDVSVDCSALPDQSKLLVSFVAPLGVQNLEGVQAYVDLHTGLPQVPAWWIFGSTFGGCRNDSLTVLSDFSSGSHAHPDPWGGRGQASVFFQPFIFGDLSTARIMVNITVAPGDSIALEPFREYDAFQVVFGNPDAGCDGCAVPTCFVVNRLVILHDGIVDYSDEGDGYSNYCRWQGDQLDCPFGVAAEPTTWGKLKASYR